MDTSSQGAIAGRCSAKAPIVPVVVWTQREADTARRTTHNSCDREVSRVGRTVASATLRASRLGDDPFPPRDKEWR
jgi:hypothetical protein